MGLKMVSETEHGISPAQRRVLDLFASCEGYNELSPSKVAQSLMDNQHLWRSVMPNSDGGLGLFLRDLPGDYTHYDTLYILTDKRRAVRLIALAHTWSADEVGLVSKGDWADKWLNLDLSLGHPGRANPNVILRVWWD